MAKLFKIQNVDATVKSEKKFVRPWENKENSFENIKLNGVPVIEKKLQENAFLKENYFDTSSYKSFNAYTKNHSNIKYARKTDQDFEICKNCEIYKFESKMGTKMFDASKKPRLNIQQRTFNGLFQFLSNCFVE